MREVNERGMEILQRFFDEQGVEHSNEEVAVIIKEAGYSLPRYYQLRTKYIKKHKTVDSEVKEFLEKIQPIAESGKNGTYAQLYAKIKGFTEKQEVSNEPTPTDINRIAIKVRDSLRKNWEANGGSCPVCGRFKILGEGTRLDTEPKHINGGEVAGVGVPA